MIVQSNPSDGGALRVAAMVSSGGARMKPGFFRRCPNETSGPKRTWRYFGTFPLPIEALTMSSVSRVEASISAENSPKATVFHNAISCDIRTACKLSGISRSYLYLVLASGQVISVKAGRRRLVLVDSLRSWLQSLPTAGLATTVPSAKRRMPAHRQRRII